MNKLSILLVTALFALIGATGVVVAGGGDYYIPVAEPVVVPDVPVVSCDPITAPNMDVTAQTDNSAIEDPAGYWTLYLYDQQQVAQWRVEWTDTSGAADVSYMFEISTSPNVDATGAFVTPIGVYSVNGVATQSNNIEITNGEDFYFHVKADSPDRCDGEYSPVEQITAVYEYYGPDGDVPQVSIIGFETPLLISAVAGLGSSAVSRKRR